MTNTRAVEVTFDDWLNYWVIKIINRGGSSYKVQNNRGGTLTFDYKDNAVSEGRRVAKEHSRLDKIPVQFVIKNRSGKVGKSTTYEEY